MIGHGAWARVLAAQPTQKNFRIAEGDGVKEIVLSLLTDQSAGGVGVPATDATSAEPTGWTVTVHYKAAPDTFLFKRTFPTEREAQGAFEDLAKAAAEVEGLVRQEKAEEAKAATDELKKKFEANTSETPILQTGQA